MSHSHLLPPGLERHRVGGLGGPLFRDRFGGEPLVVGADPGGQGPFRQLAALGLHPLWATVLIYLLAVVALLALWPRALIELLRTPSLWVLVLAAGSTSTRQRRSPWRMVSPSTDASHRARAST
mgnify:CR=1 FL=1